MIRTKHLVTAAAVMAVCAGPAYADGYQDLRSPDAKDAAAQAESSQPSQDLRSPDAKDAAAQAEASQPSQDLRSPDAVDASAHRGLYEPEGSPYVLNRDFGSPDAVDAARELPPIELPAPVVTVAETPTGFDWGDAGIGAAGMVALFSIAAGVALLITGRRRRRGLRVATH